MKYSKYLFPIVILIPQYALAFQLSDVQCSLNYRNSNGIPNSRLLELVAGDPACYPSPGGQCTREDLLRGNEQGHDFVVSKSEYSDELTLNMSKPASAGGWTEVFSSGYFDQSGTISHVRFTSFIDGYQFGIDCQLKNAKSGTRDGDPGPE